MGSPYSSRLDPKEVASIGHCRFPATSWPHGPAPLGNESGCQGVGRVVGGVQSAPPFDLHCLFCCISRAGWTDSCRTCFIPFRADALKPGEGRTSNGQPVVAMLRPKWQATGIGVVGTLVLVKVLLKVTGLVQLFASAFVLPEGLAGLNTITGRQRSGLMASSTLLRVLCAAIRPLPSDVAKTPVIV